MCKKSIKIFLTVCEKNEKIQITSGGDFFDSHCIVGDVMGVSRAESGLRQCRCLCSVQKLDESYSPNQRSGENNVNSLIIKNIR